MNRNSENMASTIIDGASVDVLRDDGIDGLAVGVFIGCDDFRVVVAVHMAAEDGFDDIGVGDKRVIDGERMGVRLRTACEMIFVVIIIGIVAADWEEIRLLRIASAKRLVDEDQHG